MRPLFENACGYAATKVIKFTHWLQKIKETNSDTDVKKSFLSEVGLEQLYCLPLLYFFGVCALYVWFGLGSFRWPKFNCQCITDYSLL